MKIGKTHRANLINLYEHWTAIQQKIAEGSPYPSSIKAALKLVPKDKRARSRASQGTQDPTPGDANPILENQDNGSHQKPTSVQSGQPEAGDDEAEVTRLRAENERLEADLEAARIEPGQLRERLANVEQQLNMRQADLEAAHNEINRLRDRIASLEQQLNMPQAA